MYIYVYPNDSAEREKPCNQYKNQTVFHSGVIFPEPPGMIHVICSYQGCTLRTIVVGPSCRFGQQATWYNTRITWQWQTMHTVAIAGRYQ